MSRVTAEIAEQIKQGLYDALQPDTFKHPGYLPNEFRGIWITDTQKRAYLRRMMEDGKIQGLCYERGWYKSYSYRRGSSETTGDKKEC